MSTKCIQLKCNIEFLKNSKVKFNENEVIFVIKDKNNKPIWLETGNSSAGLKHIIKEHDEEFLANGIKDDEIRIILHKALTEGEIIRVQGKNRNVYKVVYNLREYKIAISISSNDFIVGANISSNYKETNKNEKN